MEPVKGLEPLIIPPYKGGAVAAEPHRQKKKTGREIACMYRGPPSLLNYCKSFCPKNLQRPELCFSFVMTHEDTVSSHSFPNNYGEEFAEHY